jgi:thiamine pyrophosphate-dependent acetolactate synthase large subunit-like protein
MMGLGLALAQPRRKVLVITGDGEMLMSLGALATIAVEAPQNLTIAVLDNERFGETGMQKTHTAAGVDLAGMAAAAGIRTSRIVRTQAEVTEIRDLAHQGKGVVFAQIKISPEALPFAMPPADGVILTTRFRQSVLGDSSLYN